MGSADAIGRTVSAPKHANERSRFRIIFILRYLCRGAPAKPHYGNYRADRVPMMIPARESGSRRPLTGALLGKNSPSKILSLTRNAFVSRSTAWTRKSWISPAPVSMP
jgi:hypothetical protein